MNMHRLTEKWIINDSEKTETVNIDNLDGFNAEKNDSQLKSCRDYVV